MHGPVPKEQWIEGKFYCDVCPDFYSNKGDLQKHKKEYLVTAKKYKCGDVHCMKSYYTKRGVEEHYYNNKEHLQQYKYVCEKCGMGFSFHSEYNQLK